MEQGHLNWDEMPVFFNVSYLADLLNIGKANAYELVHRHDFPVIKIGRKYVIPRDAFYSWVQSQINDQQPNLI